MERERILRTLRADVAAAQHRRDIAAELFKEIIRDVPSAIPSPDGPERIRQAVRDFGQTQTEMGVALARLNDFIVHGVVPSSLQRKPPE
jgi:hypothetical protein